MKFALNLRKIYLITILSVASGSYLNSQQSSFVDSNHVFSINRYTFPDHLGIKKTYSISQNNLGVVFFSTNKGIITFDGIDWGVVNFTKPSYLALNFGRFYVFAENYTGEILHEPAGGYSLQEIKLKYPSQNWKPEDVAVTGDSVLISANKKIWLYRNKTLKLLADTIRLNSIFSYTKNISSNVSAPIAENVVCSYADQNNIRWILTDNAFYSLKYAEYFTQILNLPTDKKNIRSIAKDNDGIYLADAHTLSFQNKKTYSFDAEINKVFSLDGNIIVTSDKGIFHFEDNSFKKITNQSVSYACSMHDKLLYFSNKHLFSLWFNNNSAVIQEIYQLGIDSIQKISHTQNGELYILDSHNTIYLLSLTTAGYKLERFFISGDKSLQLDNIFQINNEVYACNAFNIYKVDGNKLINQEKSNINFPSQGHFTEFLEEDTAGGIFYCISKPGESKHFYYGENSGDQINWLEIPVWEAGIYNPSTISYNGNDILLYENGKLVNFKLSGFLKKPGKIKVTNSEIVVNNKLILQKQKKRGKRLVPYFESKYPVNLITLKFYANDITYSKYVRYSFLLKDKDGQWSSWSYLPEKNFSNLPPGDYTLYVKAQALNGSISEIYTLFFKITPPFYLQWYAIMIYVLIVTGIIGMLSFRRKKQFEQEKIELERIIHERTSELMKEKEKTDELLANMLPKDTADELKNTGKATSHKFDMVTVLFSDIQGFTKIAEQMNPEKLIDELDNFFFQFDSVVEKYNIEKIKTIGDAYMAAGGIPYKNRTNPVEVVLAALEMQEYMKTVKGKDTDIWDLRIGIHTGAVIAGVVGHKRLSYDIWGDTVNTASRMESSGEASKINISGQTYELVKEFFICEYRGKMPVKYKGDIDMYFVKGIRPELSVNLRSIPNKKFFIQLQLLRILDLEEYVFNKLEAELPEQLLFHNLKHTKDVYTQAELLGRAENISLEEMLILRTAALFHDTGFIWAYQNHEQKSIDFCREVLPKFKYSAEQTEVICNLILCTKKKIQPQNKLEEILIDANTDYYGRIDFIPTLLSLIKELKSYNIRTGDSWLTEQINILENHEFFTYTARRLREVPKEEQIRKIKEHLKQLV